MSDEQKPRRPMDADDGDLGEDHKRYIAEKPPVSPSLDEMIDCYQWRREFYGKYRESYQRSVGEIRDNYYARSIHAGALIVKPVGRWGRLSWLTTLLSQKRKIQLRYDGVEATTVQPEFEAAIWRARALERESALTLGGRSRKVLVEMLFTILVYLLSVLDAARAGAGANTAKQEVWRERVSSALKFANDELDRLHEFAAAAAEKASIRWYLLGLPVGAALGVGVVVLGDRWSPLLAGASNELVTISLACGAIGAIVSVMTRISRGLQIIDSEQGHLVTILAGAFRPIIGAVFGLALYVFVEGGLIPVAVPDERATMFYAGLAFLSGFNERWAQDSIVKSAPVAIAASSEQPAATPAGRRTPRKDSQEPAISALDRDRRARSGLRSLAVRRR